MLYAIIGVIALAAGLAAGYLYRKNAMDMTVSFSPASATA